jgi:hypothetical protein
MELEVFEIFHQFSQMKTRKDKIAFLKEKGNIPAVKDVIRGAFDDRLQFILPAGKPPYTPNRPESVPSTLRKKHREFGDYVKGARSAQLKQFQIEKQFIQMLEAIHPEDALIVLDMVNKKSPVKGLTKKIAEEAFPNLIS